MRKSSPGLSREPGTAGFAQLNLGFLDFMIPQTFRKRKGRPPAREKIWAASQPTRRPNGHLDYSSPQAMAQRTALCQPWSSSWRRGSSIWGWNTRSMSQLLRMSSRLSQKPTASPAR